MTKEVFLAPIIIFLMISATSAQKTKKPMTGSAARGAASGGMQVAPDLAQRLAKYRRVEMPFNSAGLAEREKKLVEKLVLQVMAEEKARRAKEVERLDRIQVRILTRPRRMKVVKPAVERKDK